MSEHVFFSLNVPVQKWQRERVKAPLWTQTLHVGRKKRLRLAWWELSRPFMKQDKRWADVCLVSIIVNLTGCNVTGPPLANKLLTASELSNKIFIDNCQ